MDRGAWTFIIVGLAAALLLAALVAPFASTSPDGLERVAKDRGFEEKMEGGAAWSHAPMADYAAPGVQSPGLSTAAAGVIGTLLVFGFALGVGWALHRRSGRRAGTAASATPGADAALLEAENRERAREDRRTWVFVLVGLGVGLIVAAYVAGQPPNESAQSFMTEQYREDQAFWDAVRLFLFMGAAIACFVAAAFLASGRRADRDAGAAP